MNQSSDSSNTRKPLKKRKMDGLDFMESDDEDENELLFGSPAFGQHKDDTRDDDKPKQQRQQPQQASPPTRRSPRGRTSIATLDGVTSSPSHVAFLQARSSSSTAHSACAAAANSPPHPFNDKNEQQKVIVLDVEDGDEDDEDYDKDDEDFELHGATKKAKPKPKSQDRKRKRSNRTDSLGNLPVTHHDSSSRFALTRVNNATSSSSSSTTTTTTTTKKKPPKEAKKEKKKPKTSIDSNSNNADKDTTVPTEKAASNTKHKSQSTRTNAASKNKVDAASKTSPATENPSPPKKTKTKKKAKKDKPAAETSTDTSKENAVNTSPTQSTLPAKKVKTTDSDGSAEKAVSEGAPSPLATQDTIAKETPKSSSTVDSSNKRSSTCSSSTEKPKKKKKKLNFQDQVFQHMFLGMKPFTLKSLAAELNQSDTALNYVMLSLVDKGLVVKRDITSNKGRTKTLYWAVDGVTSKEVAATHAANPAECQAAKQKLHSVQAELSSMLKTMADIQSDLSNQQVDERLQQQEAALKECKDKIQTIRTRLQAPVATGSTRFGAPNKTPATIPQLKRRINHMRDEWKQRKQKCMDFCDQLADAMEKKRNHVLKLLDVETDEECKVTLPAKYEVEPAAATQNKR